MMDDAKFCKTWNKADSVDKVAEVMEITKKAASTRAWELRKKSVPLKKFRENNPPLDIERLKIIAEKALSS